MVFDTQEMGLISYEVLARNWKEPYLASVEELPDDIPEYNMKPIIIRASFNNNHNSGRITNYYLTKIIIFDKL